LKEVILVLIGFCSGIIISGAVFAFISTIGIVQRLAKKTKTEKFIKLYEEAIVFGGIFGSLSKIVDYYLPINKFFICILSFCTGIFYGCLAMSLAEILDVIPILMRRGKIKNGISLFILAIAIGKLIGSLFYFLIPGFYEK
jgi:stage V sporulation protein AB